MQRFIYFCARAAEDCAQFHQNRIKIEAVGATTDGQTDAGVFTMILQSVLYALLIQSDRQR